MMVYSTKSLQVEGRCYWSASLDVHSSFYNSCACATERSADVASDCGGKTRSSEGFGPGINSDNTRW